MITAVWKQFVDLGIFTNTTERRPCNRCVAAMQYSAQTRSVNVFEQLCLGFGPTKQIVQLVAIIDSDLYVSGQ